MLLADVNVLLHAMRSDSSEHRRAYGWLAGALEAGEKVGVSELVLSGVVRIATNARVWARPSTPQEAVDFCRSLLDEEGVVRVRPGPDHFGIFTRLCLEVGARANVVPDAYHAALAIEHGATWVTSDRGFARFPGLRWRPLPAG